MEKATLCLLLRGDDEVLMARKTRGDGTGSMNFPGGKPEPEDCDDMGCCAARECREELGYSPDLDSLELVGKLRFYFANIFKWEVEVFVFRRWQEIPRIEGGDMKDPVWVKFADIPYDDMWPGDREWLPRVLNGEYVNADIYYSADHKIVEKILWKMVNF